MVSAGTKTPPPIPPRYEKLADIPGAWWVIQTHPNREKSVARKLMECGVGYFFPWELMAKWDGTRKRLVERVVFPTYLFFAGDPYTRVFVASQDYVVRTIPVHEKEQGKIREQLNALSIGLGHHLIGRELLEKQPGTPCLVTHGPMRGMKGTITKFKGERCIVLNIDFLGLATPLEIEPEFVEPLN